MLFSYHFQKNHTVMGGAGGPISKNTDGFIIHFDGKMYSND